MLKLLKGIVFFALTALLLVAFVYPFFTVPKRYEDRAREMTLARVEAEGAPADDRYIEQSVREAVDNNLGIIFKTAFICALAGAAAVYCIAVRPPHDHGGINLFNPIYLVFAAAITLLAGLVIALALDAKGGQAVGDFKALIARLPEIFPEGSWKILPLALLWAIAMELIFRGAVFSFLEKLHFSAALILAPAAYALALRFAAESYSEVCGSYSAAPDCVMLVALGFGFIQCVITWRLRSVIPAVLSHILLVYSAPRIADFAQNGAWTLKGACIALAAVTAAFVLLPLLGRRFPVLAFDFPFTRHHTRMNNWLYGTRRLKPATPAMFKKSEENAAEPVKAEETAETEKPAEEKPAEEKPAEEEPAEGKPAEEKPAEEKSAEEKPAEEKPTEEKPAEEKPTEEKPAEEKPAEEKPAEEKPAEEKPTEEKPAEEKPADGKPAEAPKGGKKAKNRSKKKGKK